MKTTSTKKVIVSGIQPTGRLHLGNYLGALKNFVKLQNEYQCYFFVADYHSITENYEPKEKPNQILSLAADFLAAGLDPKICTIFVQSDIPEHTELSWIFNCITPVSYLQRMTQYKEKALQQKENVNVGLFNYPVLQAADILIYKANLVPVGKDQDQHVELTRQIARFFNNRFGKTFAEPKSLHTETPKIMSICNPTKKMAKSLGDNHCLYIDDEPKTIAKKIAKAPTDIGDAKSPGAQNLLALAKVFSKPTIYQRFVADSKKKSLKYAELKKILATDIANYFADFRKKKKELLKNPNQIKGILTAGAKDASMVAKKTMEEVREKIGIKY
jgi:tryptophanyl-tRNA synthetase